METFRFLYIITFGILFTASSCDKNTEIPNPEELITTLTYTLIPAGGGQPVVFSFRDPDGDGGAAPVIITEPLAPNVAYNGELELLNESTNPVTDITAEIEEEGEEHQFFYGINGVHASVFYDDQDALGNPIGIKTTLATFGTGSGTIVITLRHQPDKAAPGVNNGSIQNAGGETDIEVTFPVTIQ